MFLKPHLPRADDANGHAAHELWETGFVFAGIIPRFHHERDARRIAAFTEGLGQ